MPVYMWGGGGIIAGWGMNAGKWAWGGGGGWCRGECPPGWNSGCWGKTRTRRTPFSSIIWERGEKKKIWKKCLEKEKREWEWRWKWQPVKRIQEAHKLEALIHLETSWEPEQDLWREDERKSNFYPLRKQMFYCIKQSTEWTRYFKSPNLWMKAKVFEGNRGFVQCAMTSRSSSFLNITTTDLNIRQTHNNILHVTLPYLKYWTSISVLTWWAVHHTIFFTSYDSPH